MSIFFFNGNRTVIGPERDHAVVSGGMAYRRIYRDKMAEHHTVRLVGAECFDNFPAPSFKVGIEIRPFVAHDALQPLDPA